MGYTLILLQEMNLAKMSPLHWKVACLCVNSGDINEDITSSTDYGAIAKAIARMEKGFVIPPNINTSDLGFKPDMSRNKAIYGLSAISGISFDLAKEIMKLRPYTSFEDFLEKCVKTKLVQPSKVYNLIKSGAFDDFSEDRTTIMAEFIKYLIPEKEKLTTANIPKLYEYGVIPVDFMKECGLYYFRKEVFKKENLIKPINKTQGIYSVKVDPNNFLVNIDDFIEAVEYDDEGALSLNSKIFDKLYKSRQKSFEEWIKSEEALGRFNYAARMEVWNKNCSGTIAKWEMDSICYYSKEHELEEMNISNYYDISNFKELPKEPKFEIVENPKTKKTFKKFQTYLVAGVVVEKNKNKNIVTLATLDGVVDVKLHKESFAMYDRKTSEENSWLSRGTKLIVNGYRRGETFVPRVYKDSIFRQALVKVEKSHETIRIKDVRRTESEYENNILYFC